MSKYTIEDVSHLIPVEQTRSTVVAIERYLNEGIVPPADPCLSCEPNHIRKLISLIQVGERHGLFPPKRPEFTDEGENSEEEHDEIVEQRPELMGFEEGLVEDE